MPYTGTGGEEITNEEIEGAWTNYKGWVQGEWSTYQTNLSGARAKFAAGGGDIESEAWGKIETGITSEYESALKDLRGGEHGQMLQDWKDYNIGVGSTTGTYSKDQINYMKATNLEEYMTIIYGSEAVAPQTAVKPGELSMGDLLGTANPEYEPGVVAEPEETTPTDRGQSGVGKYGVGYRPMSAAFGMFDDEDKKANIWI